MTVALPPYLRPIDEEESEDEEDEEVADDPEMTNNEETSHSYNYHHHRHRYYYYYDYDDVVSGFEDDEHGRSKEYGWSAHKSVAAGDICPPTAKGNLSMTFN